MLRLRKKLDILIKKECMHKNVLKEFDTFHQFGISDTNLIYHFHLQLWEAATGSLLENLIGHGESVNRCCFSPDGQKIASASNDQTVKVGNSLLLKSYHVSQTKLHVCWAI